MIKIPKMFSYNKEYRATTGEDVQSEDTRKLPVAERQSSQMPTE
jgi:hypothetical protein